MGLFFLSKINQTCKVCGCRDKFDFHVSDYIWEKIVPDEFQNKVLCLSCFDDFAYQKKINYAKYTNKELYFAGNEATLILKIVSAIDG